jgi:hypothetical protein
MVEWLSAFLEVEVAHLSFDVVRVTLAATGDGMAGGGPGRFIVNPI